MDKHQLLNFQKNEIFHHHDDPRIRSVRLGIRRRHKIRYLNEKLKANSVV